MAVFDAVEQRIFIRVVYDGAAGAGKTTNVRQLGSLFAAQRTREVRTPAELRGRTLYFDWLQISAGAVGGYPLLCQVLSVPGQAAFAARREHLLATADVVVVVCDSSLQELDTLRRGLRFSDEQRLACGMPMSVIVQANKQDQLDAVDGATLAQAIGRPDLEVVEAIASEGIGVVDTFVAAVRSATRLLKSRVDEGSLQIPVKRAEEEHELLSRLTTISIDRRGAAELYLEEAAAEFLLASSIHVAPAAALAAIAAEPPVEVEAVTALAAVDEEAPLIARLPQADVPTGFVWPAHTGRALLHSLSLSEDATVGSGGARRVIRDHVLSTSLADRYKDADTARHALVRAARERTQLDTLLVSDTVLVVQPAEGGTSWLWMISPCIEHVADWVTAESRPRTETLGSAVADAVAVTVRHRLALSPSVHDFGVQGGRLRYAGPLATTTVPAAAALDLLVGALDDVGSLELDVDVFIDAATRRMRSRLNADELALLAQEAESRKSPAGSARARLALAIGRFKVAA